MKHLRSCRSFLVLGLATVLANSWMPLGCAAGALPFLGGCKMKLLNEGDMGFRQSTSWSLYHRAIEGKEKVESAAELDVEPAVDLLIKLRDDAADGEETEE